MLKILSMRFIITRTFHGNEINSTDFHREMKEKTLFSPVLKYFLSNVYESVADSEFNFRSKSYHRNQTYSARKIPSRREKMA